MPPEMNQFQVAAFWVWYKSDTNGTKHERSFTRTAKRLGMSKDTIRDWHNQFGWAELAAEKDREANKRLEEAVMTEIVSTYKQALERQKTMIATLYKRFIEIIPQLAPDAIKVSDIVKLMEFETTFVFDEQRGQVAQGNLLAVILGMMPAEERTKFHGYVERARTGAGSELRGASMGSPGRN